MLGDALHLSQAREITRAIARPLYYHRRVRPGTSAYERCQKRKQRNVRFYPTAATAQREGFRACKRCRPDTVPGSPEWDVRADAVGDEPHRASDGVGALVERWRPWRAYATQHLWASLTEVRVRSENYEERW